VQFVQPGLRAGIARRTPVPTGRQCSAGTDLRTVGKRGPLELAGSVEALNEDFEP